MRHPEILGFLRAEQLTVVEVNGWQTRGGTTFGPFGSLEHATAGAATGCAPSLGTVVNGRPDLDGPLAHTLQSRCRDAHGLDVVYLVACGRANHAGAGFWLGANGNEDQWGNEVEHLNTTAEALPASRIETSARIHTAFAKCSGFTADHVAEHWEYALPAGRKTDVNRSLLNPSDLRDRVRARLAGDDDMATWNDWSEGEKMELADTVANVILGRLADDADGQPVKYPAANRLRRATRAAERIAAKLGVDLT